MDLENFRKIISFTSAEKELISSFNLPTDAFIPLLLSLRDGGDYSYSAEDIKTIAIMDKTTIYDNEKKSGYSQEDIYLFVNPDIKYEEGTVHRLEKCGEEEVRLLVRRPYKVRVESERIIKATVNPFRKEIKIEELAEKKLEFDGSTAYDIAHEMEHVKHRKIRGGSLWEFKFA